ncbi:MAG: hypothetical protein HY695_30920 [Deltaproteobacteria bacterium]|nr:hypothetical protein [Deltaproteobacteria bacterium]
MARQILVALKPQQRLDEIMPYIEEIVRPGEKVIFLMRYPVKPWLWLQDHWVTTESITQAMLAGKIMMERYSWEMQKTLAEERIAPARRVLRSKGVDVAPEIYTSSLKTVVETYTRTGEVLLLQADSGLPLMRFLRSATAFLGFFRKASFPPVLLLRPGH